MFTQEELKNLAVLVQKSQITGQEATTVALLLQKIATLLSSVQPSKDEPVSEPS